MNWISWLLIAITLWVIGRFLTVFTVRGAWNQGKLVRAPDWLLALSGFPYPEGLPRGTLSLQGLALQLTAFIMIIFRLVVSPLLPYQMSDFLGILGSFILGSIAAYVIFRISPYPADVSD
jgi:hypothetical protein